jgi:hypothetical protein
MYEQGLRFHSEAYETAIAASIQRKIIADTHGRDAPSGAYRLARHAKKAV